MKRRTLKVADIEPLVAEYNGNVAAIARRLGFSRKAVYNRINESASLQEAVEDARETCLDNVESAIYRSVVDGNVTAQIFYLKTQGKSRGWVERNEFTGADGGPIRHAKEGDPDVNIARYVDDLVGRAQARVGPGATELPRGFESPLRLDARPETD